MATEFIKEDFYKKFFKFGPEDTRNLQHACRSLWADSDILGTPRDTPIRVVSVGYGSGLRDLPVLLALRDLLKEISICRNANPPLIQVLAIEPTWVSQIESSCGELVRRGAWPESAGCDIESFEGQGIRIELVKSRVEDFQRTGPQRCEKWDIVLALSVIHLFDDWKSTLQYFLENLRLGGLFFYSETPGSINKFDGDFSSPSNPDDSWEQLWRKVYRERDNLLLPSTKIVAPRDLSFLKQCLERAGYSFYKDVTTWVHSKVSAEDIKAVIASVDGGSDAKTLGAIRIHDKARSTEFVRHALDVIEPLTASQAFEYETGYRICRFAKGGGCSFLTSVAECAARHSIQEAIERKSAIKRTLAIRPSDAPAHAEAVAAVTYDMREALGLSRDTYIVATTKKDGLYVGAVQLPPLSLIGSLCADKKRQALRFISRHAIYLSASPELHLSHLFDTSLGDLAIEVIASPDLGEHDAPRAQVQFASDGHICYVCVELPETLFLRYESILSERLGPDLNSAATDLPNDVYEGWTYEEGFTSFYFGVSPEKIRLAFAATHEGISSAVARAFLDRIDPLISGLRKSIRIALAPCNLTESELVDGIANSVRLGLIQWRENPRGLQWRSCIYIMRKTTGEKGATGNSMLLLLQDADFLAWRKRESKRSLPMLITAVEPFLNAVQEITDTELARGQGVKAQEISFAHQASAVIDSILASVQRLPGAVLESMGGLLIARFHLLRATINCYRSKVARVNVGDFPFPWKPAQSPLEVYRDIGIQLGLARCQDAKEDDVVLFAYDSLSIENQPGKPGFEKYRALFAPIPPIEDAVISSLHHSSFAVLILFALKQAVYHTVRAKLAGTGDPALIRIDILSSTTETIFECSIKNPPVPNESMQRRSKDASELQEFARRLSQVDRAIVQYEVEGPFYAEHDHCWTTITRIRAQMPTKG